MRYLDFTIVAVRLFPDKTPFLGISDLSPIPYLCGNKPFNVDTMKKIGIFYGSSTGTCEALAEQLAQELGVSSTDVASADQLTTDRIAAYDVLLLGTSTWGDGELQDDWYDAIERLKQENLTDKFVALFGCGDSVSYSDTFCDGMGILYENLLNTGCSFLGNAVDTDDYLFDHSIAVVDGHFVGLPLDEVNESDQTAQRIKTWAHQLKEALSL